MIGLEHPPHVTKVKKMKMKWPHNNYEGQKPIFH